MHDPILFGAAYYPEDWPESQRPQDIALMKKAGLQAVECQQFPGARHDIFHEKASGTAECVRHCIADWLL